MELSFVRAGLRARVVPSLPRYPDVRCGSLLSARWNVAEAPISLLGAARRLRGYDAALATGVGASVLAAATVSLFATYFEVFPMDVYFWLLLGVVAACVPESR